MSEVQTQESASPETENLASFVSRELNEEQTHEEAETDNEGEYRPNKQNYDPSEGLWPEYCNPAYKMPDVIEIKVNRAGAQYFFPLAVTKAQGKKLYLGGYRNKLNGKIYHHASTNTPTERERKMRDLSHLRSRETQTYEVKTVSVQLQRESGTQMERIDLKLDNRRDKVIIPRLYVTSDEVIVTRKQAAVTMQRYWRGFMARRRADGIRQRNREFQQKLLDEKKALIEAEEAQKLKDLSRRTNPKSNEDFAVLYNELDAWRRAEVAKIKATISDPQERSIAMEELLEAETRSLQALQQLKTRAAKAMLEDHTHGMLSQMAQPLKWQLSQGDCAYVTTPETQKAKELLELYTALQVPLLNADQRLDLLVKAKWVIEEGVMNNPNYTNYDPNDENVQMWQSLTTIDEAYELCSLIDREADLLSRSRPLNSMKRLRERINSLFLSFLQDPRVNPRAADFIHQITK